MAGAIQVKNVLRRGRRVTDVCRATIPFTGLFKGGPLGEEGPHPTG